MIANHREKVFIIAETGVNHNGDVRMALTMIDAAARAGADAVKFQTFRSEDVISRFAPKAEYQKRTTGMSGSQLEMAKKLELDAGAYKHLVSRCRKNEIRFLSTPFDIKSIEFLYKLGLGMFKIPSGEITNLPYLRKVGSLGKKIILSTGMSDLKEVGRAINILRISGTAKKDITVLHCNTEYPTPYEDVNLFAMNTIKKAFGVSVGYSDHTHGIEIPIAAVALGAEIIEKHFTLDRNMAGPDHKASIEPEDFESMVCSIRNIEKALGDGIKRPSRSESKNIPIARRSIVAAKYIRKGDIFTDENIAAKRPAVGLSPMRWDDLIGKKAKRDFKEDEAIRL